jgi:DNA-binding protein
MAEGKAKEAKGNENVVFIGKKGTMAYVLAVVTQMNQGANEVMIKARGRAISRAVDVAEIVKNKFVTDAKINGIQIATEEITTEEGNPLKVSAIEIKLNK